MATMTCPSCAKVCTLPAGFKGGRVRCPVCKVAFVIPATPAPPAPPATRNDIKPQWVKFQCPICMREMKGPDGFAGKKITCPDCGQKIIIPPTPKAKPAAANKTTLGKVEESVSITPFTPSVRPSVRQAASPPAGSRQVASPPVAATAPPKEHSALGIASFLIALLVGGLDVILIFIIAVNMATVRGQAIRQEFTTQAIGGGISLYCLNCLSLPLCLVGVGLGFVALVTQRDRNHLFSWIGVLGNGAVILFAIGFYVLLKIGAS